MGRKKKEEIKEEIKEEQSTDKSNTSIKYSGNVSITLKQGNRTLHSRNIKNAGGSSMFQFLTYCLSGIYSSAEELRPCKVMLFWNDSPAPSGASDFDGNVSVCNFKYLETSSSPANTTYTDSNTDEIIPQWSTTLHFRIPYSWIRAGISTNNEINTVCLYGKNAVEPPSGELGSYAAKFQFIDPEADIWNPITVSNTDNTNIIIDWTITIENK